MKAPYLGHVVHYVKDLEQSLAGFGKTQFTLKSRCVLTRGVDT